MKLLVIGGTKYVGRNIVEAAVAGGHEVTMFNRGLSNPDLFPEVERLTGDRADDDALAQLRGREWDAVVDTCGYDPRVVRKTLEALAAGVGHYTFISSIGVYRDFIAPNAEDAPKAPLLGDPDVPMDRAYGGSAHYGPLKVLCEEAVAEAFPERWSTIRLTIGVGPNYRGASSARGVTYWGKRVRDYDPILVPGPPDRAVNMIDLRDMAVFAVEGGRSGRVGAFNMASPRTTIKDALLTCAGLYGTRPELVFADGDWLVEQGVKQNTELPWWVNGPQGAYTFGVVQEKAVAAGLRHRPLADSMGDSVAWDDDPASAEKTAELEGTQAGEHGGFWDTSLTRERELELIELWRGRSG